MDNAWCCLGYLMILGSDSGLPFEIRTGLPLALFMTFGADFRTRSWHVWETCSLSLTTPGEHGLKWKCEAGSNPKLVGEGNYFVARFEIQEWVKYGGCFHYLNSVSNLNLFDISDNPSANLSERLRSGRY